MSSAMQNFMGAYVAVHNSEAKEEYYSVRDAVSEMNTGVLTDNDLREIAEEVCETLFGEEMKLEEVENILTEVLEEGQNVGRNSKTSRLLAAFIETFDRIKSKANRLESFAEYRESKKLQETWSSRFNQDKRVQRHHSALVAKECANVKSGLLELYKGKHGQTEKQYQDSRSDAGKMVSGDSKGSGANYSYRAKNTGSNPAGGSEKPQGQARMGSKDRSYLKMQKANLKKKSMKESWADAYTAIYEKKADKDYDGDGKIESGTDEYMGSKDKAIKKAMGKKGVKEDTCAYNAKGEDCPKHGKETDCTMKEGVRDMNPEKGTAERKARLEKKRGMKMDDHPQYKKESVQFSERELKKFEEIVNSWSD